MANLIPEGITPESIKASILSAIKTDIDTREGSFADDLCGPMALELWRAYQTLNSILPSYTWTRPAGPTSTGGAPLMA